MVHKTSRQFHLAAGGDSLINRRLFVDDSSEFDDLVDILRGADASMVNLEHPVSNLEGHPAPGGGLRHSASPLVIEELEKMGFNLFSTATNHAWDYTYEGILRTIEELQDRNVSFAGIGKNLSDARAPTYVDTPAGRIALISTCATVTPGSSAGMQRPDLQGRPGISPLRLDTSYVVPEKKYHQLKRISESMGLEVIKEQREGHGVPKGYKNEDAFYLLDIGIDDGRSIKFKPGEDTGVHQEIRQKDMDALEQEIKAANRHASWVVMSLHAHEGADGRYNGGDAASFIQRFAHECINTGVDAFIGHGPHVIRGIEIYENKPIFYSVGNFTLQHPTISKLPAETFESRGYEYDAHISNINPETSIARDGCYQGIIPVCEFIGDTLSEVNIYPIDLGRELPYPQKGVPRVASDSAEEIIDVVKERSEKYDTEITFDGEIGKIKM